MKKRIIWTAHRRKPLRQQLAVGPCPYCGQLDNWLNDVPLRAFCWGTENSPHRQWQKLVPAPFNPYLNGFSKTAKPPVIKFVYRPSWGKR
jgi:hypothetical protein